jgi:hypothetical protein
MPQLAEETIEQWHRRALEECIANGDALELLGQRRITIADALTGNVFGPVDAEYAAVCARLEVARVDLLAAVAEIKRSSVDGFWSRDRRRDE